MEEFVGVIGTSRRAGMLDPHHQVIELGHLARGGLSGEDAIIGLTLAETALAVGSDQDIGRAVSRQFPSRRSHCACAT